MSDSASVSRLSALHIPALDGVRGLAILLVVPHNSSLMDAVAFHGLAYPVNAFMMFGWTGVQLFFVLSGFLISGALLDTQDSPSYYRSFYARRVLRILPLYYGVLVVTFLVLAPLQLLPADTLRTQQHQVWLWTFLSNWTDPLGFEVKGFDHFWSLAVEEQFYLLWPLVLHRTRPQRVVTLSLAICAAVLAVRVAMRVVGCDPGYLYEFSICRMDALAMGAAAAASLRVPSWRERVENRLPYLPWAALLVLASGALLTHDYSRTGWATQTFGLSALAVAFALLILAAAPTPGAHPTWLSRALCLAPLRSAGKYSYAMYVFHFPITKLLGVPLLGVPLLGAAATTRSATIAVLYAAAITLVTYLCAWVSYHVYEQHFLRLKRYFVPTRTRLAEAV